LQVVLRLGGVYADLDTECRKPLSDLIQPRDTLIAGWENEFDVPADAEKRHYVRSRQVDARWMTLCLRQVLCWHAAVHYGA
jgi:mannosyltransferase OCH1-like enzyme